MAAPPFAQVPTNLIYKGKYMKTIHKYQLDPRDLNLSLPVGAKLLAAQEQNNQICVWAEVDTEADTELVGFEVFGTGHEMTDAPREYIGTAFIDGGGFVFHIYKMI